VGEVGLIFAKGKLERMKKLTVSLSDELDAALRKYVAAEFDGLKGGLSFVVKTALQEFLRSRTLDA